ncbi:hypothetical protein N0V86_007083 [Didymella sp. IMI 355093]|nr:hypothetical protein N0V86_007083 [Didymella sp. IMI 355093]
MSRPSDSGFGTQPSSLAEEPQAHGMYAFGGAGWEGSIYSDQSGQPMPHYTPSVDTFGTAHDFFWRAEEPQLGGQDRVPIMFENVDDLQLDPADNYVPTPDQGFDASRQRQRRK